MHDSPNYSTQALTRRLVTAAVLLTTLAVTTLLPVTARALELIPSVGAAKSTDSNAGDAVFYGGLALRAPLFPFLKLEGGVNYRQDNYFNNDLKVRSWPVTASAWLSPFPMLYAGGGLGWYRTTYDFNSTLLTKDWTTDQVGVHIGGGLVLPISPQLGLDLNGRYVFLQKKNDIALPTTFNPDFWNASLGLAIKF